MSLAQLIPLALEISIGLIVLAIGLRATPGDLTYVLRKPSLLLRSVLAMNVLMPLVAAGIAAAFHLRPAVEAALILLAVSPVPPILPGKEQKAGGNVSYAVGLLAVSAVLAIGSAPASIVLIGKLFGYSLDVPVARVVKVVASSVLVPLILGAIVRRLVPGAARVAKGLSRIGSVVLLLGIVPVLVTTVPKMFALLGGFTLVAGAAFALVSLLVGHLLGGPAEDDRTVLALSTASRHPGVALAMGAAIANDPKSLSAAVLFTFLVSVIVTGPYVKWRKRGGAAHPAPAAQA